MNFQIGDVVHFSRYGYRIETGVIANYYMNESGLPRYVIYYWNEREHCILIVFRSATDIKLVNSKLHSGLLDRLNTDNVGGVIWTYT